MKGGRIVLPSAYFNENSENNTANYLDGPMPNIGSRSQMLCDNFVGPDNEVLGGEHLKSQNGGRYRKRKSNSRRRQYGGYQTDPEMSTPEMSEEVMNMIQGEPSTSEYVEVSEQDA